MVIRAAKLAACMILGATALPIRGDIVILDNDFNDPNNSLALNTNGIGGGFTAFATGGNASQFARETNSLLQLSSAANGAARENAVSIDAIPVNGGGTRIEFRGVQFANQTANTGTGNTDRLFLGIGSQAAAGDFYESGAANMPSGFWIQIMSDSIVTGSGNGSWTGTSALFHKSADGTRTLLASWVFDNLRWSPAGPNNFSPTLNITLTLSGTNWSLNMTGDTQGGSPITFSGAYADAGLDVNLLNGINNPRIAFFNQTEGPGIILSCDRVVVTQVGNLIVTTPRFSTPAYGFNTNRVLAGEAVSLSSTVTSGTTPALQWQIEDPSGTGTFTNVPNATTTNLDLNTSAFGDSMPRRLRLSANDGVNTVISPAVPLTVDPGSQPIVAQDTTPAGPETRNVGLGYSLSATFSGNRPFAYQWQKSPDGTTWANIPSQTNTTLILASLQPSDSGFYRLTATNALGGGVSSASQLTVTAGSVKYLWSAPVSLIGLNADQILTNFPGTKIAGAMRGNGGPTTVTLSSGSPIVFAQPNTWASRTGGNGGGNGAFPGTNTIYTTTGNGSFNTCLNNFYFDGAIHTITMSNLVVGKQYSLQLFSLDGRNLNPPANTRTVNWQDPADPTDVSSTYSMADFVYVVGTFYASNSTESVQLNLLTGSGNFNCLVLRAVGFDPPPYFTVQPGIPGGYVGGSLTIPGAQVAGDTTIANPTITYQWQAGPAGGPYTNLIEGAKYTGVTTATLTVNSLTLGDANVAHVLKATNGGGSALSREVNPNVQPQFPQYLLGRWLSGAPDLNFPDTSGYTPAGTHNGIVTGTGTVYYFTNDVPPGATGTHSLYLGGNVAIAINNTSLTLDPGYTNTFDETISNHFTVMFWAKGFPPGTWAPAFVGKRGEDNVGFQIRRLSGNGNPGFTLRGTGGADDPNGSIAVDTNSWHHYAGTWDSLTGIRRFYVDGRLASQTTGDTGDMDLASNFHLTLGARESSTPGTAEAFFTGNLYDMRVYNYSLGQNEVGNIAGLPPTLTFQRPGTGQLVLTWPYGTLLEATNVTGPWTTNSTTSPYTNNMTDPQKYFRVQNP